MLVLSFSNLRFFTIRSSRPHNFVSYLSQWPRKISPVLAPQPPRWPTQGLSSLESAAKWPLWPRQLWPWVSWVLFFCYKHSNLLYSCRCASFRDSHYRTTSLHGERDTPLCRYQGQIHYIWVLRWRSCSSTLHCSPRSYHRWLRSPSDNWRLLFRCPWWCCG